MRFCIKTRETVIRIHEIEADTADEALRAFIEEGQGEVIWEEVINSDRLTDPVSAPVTKTSVIKALAEAHGLNVVDLEIER